MRICCNGSRRCSRLRAGLGTGEVGRPMELEMVVDVYFSFESVALAGFDFVKW